MHLLEHFLREPPAYGRGDGDGAMVPLERVVLKGNAMVYYSTKTDGNCSNMKAFSREVEIISSSLTIADKTHYAFWGTQDIGGDFRDLWVSFTYEVNDGTASLRPGVANKVKSFGDIVQVVNANFHMKKAFTDFEPFALEYVNVTPSVDGCPRQVFFWVSSVKPL